MNHRASSIVQSLNAVQSGPYAEFSFHGSVPFGDQAISRYRMKNGLSILFLRDDAADVACYQTWFGVGSRHEKPHKTGLAHLFEHLMFNEVEGLGAGQFDRLLEAAGGQVNAATWCDWTFYYENVPASELDLVVRLEALRMNKLVLREPQVASEKEVVANERRYRVDDDVEGSVNELLYKNAFTVHPYHWPTIGWMEDIQGFTTADCAAFYQTYYAPNNACIVIVGNVDEQEALRKIQTYYGAIAPSQLPSEAPVIEPEQDTERSLRTEKPTPTEKVAIGYKSPRFGSQEFAALTVLNEIMFGGKSSRLYRALITEGELASEVRGSLAPLRDPGLYEVWVSMREGHTSSEALAHINAAFARLATEEVSGAELDKAKNRLELAFVQGMETMSGKAEQIGFYETVLGDAGRIFEQLDLYRAVAAADVRRVAATYLRSTRRTLVFVTPSAEAALEDGAAS